uniref:CCHC-type domain-containing protein n=1 Tax=Physcomitrium patens TaxID=3218 RepID=A0A2K1J8I6_PHYPA|nr:hypothetical protein PHYPA_020943 [Physcomitrium patens]
MICHHCGKPGHTSRFCRAPALLPYQPSSSHGNSITGGAFSTGPPQNNVSQKLGVKLTEEFSGELQNHPNDNVILKALELRTLSNSNNDWNLDLGASKYFLVNYSAFNHIDQLDIAFFEWHWLL